MAGPARRARTGATAGSTQPTRPRATAGPTQPTRPRTLVTVLIAAGFAGVTGAGTLVAALAGFAAAPRALAAVFALAAGALVGLAATPLIHAAVDPVPRQTPDEETRKGPRSHRRAAPASPLRLAVVAGAVVVLALVCWVRPGEPGRVLFGLARAAVGLFAYALPLVPLFSLVPPGQRTRIPWQALWRALRPAASPGPQDDQERRPGSALWTAFSAARDAVFGSAAGLVLATVALFHLLRGQPGLEESAYRLAGGLLGIVAATPLAGLFSAAGAVGLLLAVLVGVAAVTAGRLNAPLGRYPALAALVMLVVVPVAAAGVSNRVGYRYFLGADGDRVVVIAGLSLHHRHDTYDAAVALAAVPEAVRPALRKGFPVTDRDDGRRVAQGLADPAKGAADGFPDGALTLRTGECFSFVGGTSNFRYAVPCNGEHTGEVFYVGRLPFTADPGADVRAAAARGVCEKAYGGYLGAPYGTSYLPMEPPVTQRNLVACLFAALGPWPLRDTRTVASLQQQRLDWAPGPGCAVEPGMRIVAGRPGQVCVAPGKAVGAVGTVPITVDAEFQPVGRGAGTGRVGVACTGADAVTGYYATVGGDGVLTLTRQQGTTRTPLGTAGKARSAPSPQTTVTQVQLTCRQVDAAVQLVVAAGKGRELTVTDPQGITALSPRLVVEAAEAPVTATVTLFTAKVV